MAGAVQVIKRQEALTNVAKHAHESGLWGTTLRVAIRIAGVGGRSIAKNQIANRLSLSPQP